ncbi:MAG: PadR family transcriptional regulator [Candidatus Kariarchaeaceae archaeon]
MTISNHPSTKINTIFRILVISLLNEGPKTGYELIKSLEEILGSKPSHGKIYPFLHELLEDGKIEEFSIEPNEPRPKRKYKLTPIGVKILETVFEKLEIFFSSFLGTCQNCECQYLLNKKLKNNSSSKNTFYCIHCKDQDN